MLKEKYKELFNIDEVDYKKAKYYYDTYLGIFDRLLKPNNDSPKYAEIIKIKKDIEESNPWKEAGYHKDGYDFNSLAGSDREILGPLLIKNIEKLREERKQKNLKNEGEDDPKKIIEDRFKDFEQAFDGNFIDPKVIIIGINPKMSATHDSYGLEKTVYKNPFDYKRSILQNCYYFGKDKCTEEGKCNHNSDGYGILYKDDDNNASLKKIHKKHKDIMDSEDTTKPLALWEFFPYASEDENNWQKEYRILGNLKKDKEKIKPYIDLDKVLPSQIWMLCLLTFAIKISNLDSSKLRLFLKKNKETFRDKFTNPYFKLLELEKNENIGVLVKKNARGKKISMGNSKPYFEGQTLKNLGLKEDDDTEFFMSLWGIENKDQ